MNLKERGVTVGDLLIVSVILISTIFIINKVKETDTQSYLYLNSKEISTTKII
tara:strand:- start:628 stop:786 length:159 start_codon:yes stop_codon:yes gene_type:complete